MAEWITAKELAQELKVTDRTVRYWAQKGQIPAVRVGRQFRFRRKDVEAWLSSNNASHSKHLEEEPTDPERLKGADTFSQEAWDRDWREFMRRVKEMYERK